MTSPLLARAVALASDTEVVEIGRGVLADVAHHVAGLGAPLLIVADQTTWAAAGERVSGLLAEAGVPMVAPLIFPGLPSLHPTRETCDVVRAALEGSGACGVAVGSGSLNDVVKRASFEVGRPYAVIATAASMDGYTGFGAPITVDGLKVTMPCPAPRVAILDLDVMAAAPAPMVASGYGDLLAKLPGGADWILADAAGVEPIDPVAWELVQDGVREALAHPDELAAGDAAAYQGLVEGLCLSGLAMQVYEGTRPASGAEHYFSHIWELAGLGADLEPPLSHGFKVGIGTLTMTAFTEALLARDLSRLDIDVAVNRYPTWAEVEADVSRHLSGPLVANAIKETRVKYVDEEGLRDRLGRIASHWDAVRARVEAQLMPARVLQDMLERVGAPSRPEHIGLTREDVRATFPKAMYYRSRYTALDMARETGIFDELVAEVFAPGGFWG